MIIAKVTPTSLSTREPGQRTQERTHVVMNNPFSSHHPMLPYLSMIFSWVGLSQLLRLRVFHFHF